MKILILVNALLPGGAERQAVQDANMLLEKGHEVVVCYGIDGPLRIQLEPGINLFDLKTKSQIKAIFRLTRFIKKNKIELVFSHMFWANKIATAACFLSGRKNIAFEHGLNLWRKWYHIVFSNLISRYAKAIVTCSVASEKLKIKREFMSPGKLVVIYNSFQKPDILNDNKVLHDNKKFKIGYAGRFNKVKQLPLLIDIAEKLLENTNDFCFVLLGDGAEKSLMENLVKEKKLDKCFEFTGYVQDPMQYLQKMDCFVLPSKREDFSLALLEASFAGLPCIAFDVGGNGEIIIDSKTGFIIPAYDIRIFADKLKYLIANPAARIEMSKAAHEFVNRNFTIEHRLKKLNELIKKIS